MIYFLRAKVLESGLVNFIIKIDAAAADIKNRDKKLFVESELDRKIWKLAYEIREGIGAESESDLRKFIRDELFVHFVDMSVVEKFVTNVKNQSLKYANDIAKIGLDILYEYENHPWKDEDEDRKKRWKKNGTNIRNSSS